MIQGRSFQYITAHQGKKKSELWSNILYFAVSVTMFILVLFVLGLGPTDITAWGVSEECIQAVDSGRLIGKLQTNRARDTPWVMVKIDFGSHLPLSEMTGKSRDLQEYFKF